MPSEDSSIPAPTDPVPNPTTDTSPGIDVHPYLPGTPHNPPVPPRLAYPIKLNPLKKKIYYEPKQDFSIIAMFQGNPMMLIMVGTVLFSFLMPKLMVSTQAAFEWLSFS